MDCSTSGFPILHYLLKLAQIHVHWINDAIQPSHPLSSPSPPALNLSQHQSIFPKSWLFTSSGQRIGVSASASVVPMNIQGWFPLGWTDTLLQSKGLSRVFSSTTVWKQILWCSAFFMVQFSYPYMTPGKAIALTTRTFVGKVMALLFNTLSAFLIAFLPRSKCLLISRLQSLSTVNLSLLLHFPLLLAMKWWDQVPWSWFFPIFRIQKLEMPPQSFSILNLSSKRRSFPFLPGGDARGKRCFSIGLGARSLKALSKHDRQRVDLRRSETSLRGEWDKRLESVPRRHGSA